MRRLIRLLFVLTLLAGVAATPVRAQEQTPVPTPMEDGAMPPAADDATAPEAPPTATLVAPTATPSVSPTAVPSSAADIATAAQASVVHIVTDATMGSGVRINEGILTSAHVVNDTAQIEVYAADHRHGHATLKRVDPTADVALLTTDLALPALDLEPVAGQKVGDRVVALGYPGDAADPGPATAAPGQLSSTGTGIQGRSLLETTADLQPGFSGGPLLNSRGHVVGVNTFVASVEGGLKLNFFVGSDTAYAFLALPDASVAPRPMALFKLDPRSASLPLAYLGTGWVLDSEDTSQLSQGSYWSKFHLASQDGSGPVQVQAGVAVTSSPAAAAQGLPQVVPSDQQFDYIGSPNLGDAAGAWLSKSGRTAIVAARVANVVVVAVESRTTPLLRDNVIGAGSVSDMVRYMCDRVVSQVH